MRFRGGDHEGAGLEGEPRPCGLRRARLISQRQVGQVCVCVYTCVCVCACSLFRTLAGSRVFVSVSDGKRHRPIRIKETTTLFFSVCLAVQLC